MPYTIVKRKGHCYAVKNKDTGKLHSKKCMTRTNAIAQKMILEREHKKEGGK